VVDISGCTEGDDHGPSPGVGGQVISPTAERNPGMTRPFRFGLVAPLRTDLPTWLARVRRIADSRYSALLMPDFPRLQPAPGPTLATAAALTDLRVGTWVYASPHGRRRHGSCRASPPPTPPPSPGRGRCAVRGASAGRGRSLHLAGPRSAAPSWGRSPPLGRRPGAAGQVVWREYLHDLR